MKAKQGIYSEDAGDFLKEETTGENILFDSEEEAALVLYHLLKKETGLNIQELHILPFACPAQLKQMEDVSNED